MTFTLANTDSKLSLRDGKMRIRWPINIVRGNGHKNYHRVALISLACTVFIVVLMKLADPILDLTIALLTFSSVAGAHRLPAHLLSSSSTTKSTATASNKVNSTLDFQHIFVLNEPQHWNRRDEISLMAAVQGLKISYIEAQRPWELLYTGLPWHAPEVLANHLATFRSHANIWRKMIDEDIQTAFVMEDTTDWDENIRSQLSLLRKPLATLLTSTDKRQSDMIKQRLPTKKSPYMDSDWDILFTGSCGEAPFTAQNSPHSVDADKPPYVSYSDPSTPSCDNIHPSHRAWLDHYSHFDFVGCSQQKFSEKADLRRVITKAHSPSCLTSYAVSKKGAAKLLYYTSRGLDDTLDGILAQLCGLDLIRGYTVIPAITGSWIDEDWSRKRNPSIGRTIGLKNSLRKGLKYQILEY